MKNDEIKHLINDARHEIRVLRRSNEIMAAKLEMINLFERVLYAEPPKQQSQGASPDIAWMLDRAYDELAKEETK